jgi:hypothetical protein
LCSSVDALSKSAPKASSINTGELEAAARREKLAQLHAQHKQMAHTQLSCVPMLEGIAEGWSTTILSLYRLFTESSATLSALGNSTLTLRSRSASETASESGGNGNGLGTSDGNGLPLHVARIEEESDDEALMFVIGTIAAGGDDAVRPRARTEGALADLPQSQKPGKERNFKQRAFGLLRRLGSSGSGGSITGNSQKVSESDS